MLMVIGCLIVLAGVVIGWYSIGGSGIHRRPHGRDRFEGESPLESPWRMGEWSRGTQSSRRRRRR